MNEAPAVGRPGSAIKMSILPRLGSGTAGVAALVAGCVAVFTRDVEAGPVALILMGSLFLLISIVGHVPTRLKIGDHEAEWLDAASVALDKVIDAVPPENHSSVEAAIEELSERAPELGERVRANISIDLMLLDRVQVAASRVGIRMELASQYNIGGARPNAILTGSSGRKIWVIAHGRRMKEWEKGAANRLLSRIKEKDETFVGVLVMTFAAGDSGRMEEVRGEAGTVWIVPVRQGIDTVEVDALLVDSGI